ncbi:hypothetical protein K6T82_06915 [Flavobacterium sp. 17A]|uniref:Uncharacterized protein n=1 Tax=Flavobacterium potami TaxID=2872310 RepID=A0A9X1H8K6_9FLAO|nr:hypothetical protein [Flavobacterium potami]MBZ4034490.1 hypothetical protein [Flavobacterium potami]
MIKKIIFLLCIAFIINTNAQTTSEFSSVKTQTGDVKIPGNWQQLNTENDSGQTYLKNSEGVIIAIAQNPKKAYSFFKSNKSDFENVKLFYAWDSDYMKENKLKIDKIKENSKSEYIIWKYNDGKLDNVFLFGSAKDNFLNLLVYTNIWDEAKKVMFLESLYELNK